MGSNRWKLYRYSDGFMVADVYNKRHGWAIVTQENTIEDLAQKFATAYPLRKLARATIVHTQTPLLLNRPWQTATMQESINMDGVSLQDWQTFSSILKQRWGSYELHSFGRGARGKIFYAPDIQQFLITHPGESSHGIQIYCCAGTLAELREKKPLYLHQYRSWPSQRTSLGWQRWHSGVRTNNTGTIR